MQREAIWHPGMQAALGPCACCGKTQWVVWGSYAGEQAVTYWFAMTDRHDHGSLLVVVHGRERWCAAVRLGVMYNDLLGPGPHLTYGKMDVESHPIALPDGLAGRRVSGEEWWTTPPEVWSRRLERVRKTVLQEDARIRRWFEEQVVELGPAEPGWEQWAQEALDALEPRNEALAARWGLRGGGRFDLDAATWTEDGRDGSVEFDLEFVGYRSSGTGEFAWGWTKREGVPAATRRIGAVTRYGQVQAVVLPEVGLVKRMAAARWPGSDADELEALAVAARLLRADGTRVLRGTDKALYFVLYER